MAPKPRNVQGMLGAGEKVMIATGQETRLPSAPERGETMELAGSASCVTTADDGHRKEAADRVSTPEMGNRKSSARNSGNASGGITSVEVSALFVKRNGHYFGVGGVDPWDEARDARKYAGPHPVVAHPPCERWGRMWFGSPLKPDRQKYQLGGDGGTFAAALAAVRKFGGVLEHPEGSNAWRRFDLIAPPRHGGWVAADF